MKSALPVSDGETGTHLGSHDYLDHSAGHNPSRRSGLGKIETRGDGLPMIRRALRIRQGERAFDLYSRLLRERIHFPRRSPSPRSQRNRVVAQPGLFLESRRSRQDIYLYVNSPGGSVYDGLGIFDTCSTSSLMFRLYVVGLAATWGLFLLNAGAEASAASCTTPRIMSTSLGGARGKPATSAFQAMKFSSYKTKLNRSWQLPPANSLCTDRAQDTDREIPFNVTGRGRDLRH